MAKIIIVSNRLPVSVVRKKSSLTFKPSIGGLATGVRSIHEEMNTLWIGWPGFVPKSKDEKERVTETLKELNFHSIFLTEKIIEKYYEGFSNRTIWPLFHYFPQYAEFDEIFWKAYERVNRMFAECIREVYKKGDYIWIHDYQLMLTCGFVRELLPKAIIGFFLHIPFPSFEIYRFLPWRKSILKGILGADLVGFHIFDYTRHFLSAQSRLLGYDHEIGTIQYDNRLIKVDTFPMGIDYKKYSQAYMLKETKAEIARLSQKNKKLKTILSIDRLDYSKGLLQRLEVFHQLLHKNQSLKEKVQFIILVVPSRARVESYKTLKRQIDERVGRINGVHGTLEWQPIRYFYRTMPFESIVALYNIADVCLVTPFRDGMNLVAKEYIASRKNGDGVLIISEMAGAAGELGEALIVNPNDLDETVQVMQKALDMDKNEQYQRITTMQKRLKNYDIHKWAFDFLNRLKDIEKGKIESEIQFITDDLKNKIKNKIWNCSSSLLLLDYDGTLVPFASRPELAKPTKRLIQLLQKLDLADNIKIAIISGRDRQSLDLFFPEQEFIKIAEHGAWIKENGMEWYTIELFSQDWKNSLRHILELYTDRTPGTFIEEKDFSLVWHFRKADIGLGEVRARELIEALNYMTANLNLQVLEGKKVIEIKNYGISKGRAALHLLHKLEPECIVAVGDDFTDEDTFQALPDSAYTIKVGKGQTFAKYHIKNSEQVVQLLSEINQKI